MPRSTRLLTRSLCALLLAAPLLPTTGCFDGDDDDPVVEPEEAELAGRTFEALPRTVSLADSAARRATLAARHVPAERTRAASGDDDFYLLIKKRDLGERYFLSAFLEQYFPGAVAGGAASSLGTRVVSFKAQNDKLVVFDVSDRHPAGGDVFDAEILIDSYPIVGERVFRTPRGRETYVVVDPSAGLNRFNVVSDALTSFNWVPFTVDLSFLQEFRATDDGGATWEQVFTGTAAEPVPELELASLNPFAASGTVTMALRPYREGEHFQSVPMPDRSYYFRGTFLERTAAHWDIYPGMPPIEWLISPALVELDQQPEYADVDVVGAIEASIAAWNDAFGFPVFSVRVAEPDESFAQDDKNHFIFDPTPGSRPAWANWRTNPNTGEIRGTNVYFNIGWLDRSRFEDDPAGEDGQPPARASMPSLRWQPMASDPLCVMWADDVGAAPGPADASLTSGQKLERYFGHMITHELGHNLGLRHNFKGSMTTEGVTTSAMEYLLRADRVVFGGAVGPYDAAAVRFLYGLSPDEPDQQFCTDGDIYQDPDCAMHDRGADPFRDFYLPGYAQVRDHYTGRGWFEERQVGEWLEGLKTYVTSWDWRGHEAWAALKEGVAVPLDPDLAADGWYAEGADRLWLDVLTTMLDPWMIPEDIAYDAIDQARAVLANEDGARSWTTRRALIDRLRALQSMDGYRALAEARAAMAAQLEAATGDDALLLADLIARIDDATSPYFDLEPTF